MIKSPIFMVKHGETLAFLPPLASATASFRAFDVVRRFRSGFRGLPAVSSQRLQLGGGASGVVRRHVSGKNLLGKHKKHLLGKDPELCWLFFSVFGTFGGSAFLPVFLAICSIWELEAAISTVLAISWTWNLSFSIEFATFWWNL